jgi:hypothetical protein
MADYDSMSFFCTVRDGVVDIKGAVRDDLL